MEWLQINSPMAGLVQDCSASHNRPVRAPRNPGQVRATIAALIMMAGIPVALCGLAVLVYQGAGWLVSGDLVFAPNISSAADRGIFNYLETGMAVTGIGLLLLAIGTALDILVYRFVQRGRGADQNWRPLDFHRQSQAAPRVFATIRVERNQPQVSRFSDSSKTAD